jgi:VanZ family protein
MVNTENTNLDQPISSPKHIKQRANHDSFDTLADMARLRRFLTIWLPVILWITLIFFLSTDTFSDGNTSKIINKLIARLPPEILVGEMDIIHLLVRKIGHWTEFLILSVLVLRALENTQRQTWSRRLTFWTLGTVFVFAIADELHQSLLSTRTGLVSDVLVDVLGGGSGVFLMYIRRKRHRSTDEDRMR